MNRIEQVAPSAPAQQPQPQPLPPRALADLRRRAAHAMVRSGAGSSRARRGTSRLAVAIAALAVPLLPGQAFGATSSAGDRGTAHGIGAVKAPYVRHHGRHVHHGQHQHGQRIQHGKHGQQVRHVRHNEVIPDPGPATLQRWAAGGWMLTRPERPADAGLWDRLFLDLHHDGHYVPWLVEPTDPAYARHPRPVVLPDGTRGEIAAYRVHHTARHTAPHTAPRALDPDAPDSQAPTDLADSTGQDGYGSGGWSQFGDASGDRTADQLADLRGARSRVMPDPLIAFAAPANTKQMLGPGKQDAGIPEGAANHVPVVGRSLPAFDPAASPCLRAAYLAGKDRRMLAHLRPAMDAMNVVVNHRHAACAAMVDYLSQARA